MACAPSKDSDQSGHRHEEAWALSYPLSTQRRLIRLGGCTGWSESSLGAQSFCWFCHEAAQLYCKSFQFHAQFMFTIFMRQIFSRINSPWKFDTSIIANGTREGNAKINCRELTFHRQNTKINSHENKLVYSNFCAKLSMNMSEKCNKADNPLIASNAVCDEVEIPLGKKLINAQ